MQSQIVERNTPLRMTVEKAVDNSLKRIRQHPFIVEANAQLLTREQSERWIMCAGRESRSFPHILENMVKRCSNNLVKEILISNLEDEYGNGDPEHAHFKHYLHLLDKLNIPRERFYQYEERAGIKLALSLAYNISMQPQEALAIGYMLVNEGMTQITYGAVDKALHRYYSGLKTMFFDLHVEVDEKHVEDLYTAVSEMESAQSSALLFGISVGERGMAVLLDEAYGLFDYLDTVPAYDPV
jgi:pyrroloquinoline quinone (PQQ) biosynthesis protein C